MGKKGCERSCPGVIVNKAEGRYCPHIEAKMPKPSRQSVKDRSYGDVNWFSKLLYDRETSVAVIEAKLRAFGLREYEVEVLMLRYAENKTASEIMKELGWTSRG